MSCHIDRANQHGCHSLSRVINFKTALPLQTPQEMPQLWVPTIPPSHPYPVSPESSHLCFTGTTTDRIQALSAVKRLSSWLMPVYPCKSSYAHTRVRVKYMWTHKSIHYRETVGTKQHVLWGVSNSSPSAFAGAGSARFLPGDKRGAVYS